MKRITSGLPTILELSGHPIQNVVRIPARVKTADVSDGMLCASRRINLSVGFFYPAFQFTTTVKDGEAAAVAIPPRKQARLGNAVMEFDAQC
jgi:hypothetical protein